MFKKVCTECTKPSFSSIDSGTWLRPICGADISKVSLEASESHKIHKTVPLPANYVKKHQGGRGSQRNFVGSF